MLLNLHLRFPPHLFQTSIHLQTNQNNFQIQFSIPPNSIHHTHHDSAVAIQFPKFATTVQNFNFVSKFDSIWISKPERICISTQFSKSILIFFASHHIALVNHFHLQNYNKLFNDSSTIWFSNFYIWISTRFEFSTNSNQQLKFNNLISNFKFTLYN